MTTTEPATATAVIRADKSPVHLQRQIRLPEIAGEPFSYLPWRWRGLARFCSRLSRCRLPHRLLRRRLLLRYVLLLHLGLVPVKKEGWVRIVGGQRSGEVDCGVLFDARRFRLPDDLNFHVGRRSRLEFRITGYKRHFQHY